MFWFAFLVVMTFFSIFAVRSAIAAERKLQATRAKAREDRYKFYSSYDYPRRPSPYWAAGVGLVLCLAYAIACLVGVGVLIDTDLSARKAEWLLPQKQAQREALIVDVRAELSTEEYARLTSITAPDVFVVFAQGTAAADVLIARASQIVALNSSIYELRNELDGLRIDVCNALDNPFFPRFPFVGPDCEWSDPS